MQGLSAPNNVNVLTVIMGVQIIVWAIREWKFRSMPDSNMLMNSFNFSVDKQIRLI